ncbi:mersacidin/lichenicidin family type 2 lantibiotic [Micromonospora luteifusca]|uniref:mersacidin/lichenicidin family type 2 lantibiotic n=1 Tax=Micromonospora luteifusca TaxID=709860 RepID=UPI0033A3C5AE
MNTAAKAWKDPVFRATLNDSELAALPVHPVGAVEFDDMGMDDTRGAGSEANMSFGCCNNASITMRTCLTCGWPCWPWTA